MNLKIKRYKNILLEQWLGIAAFSQNFNRENVMKSLFMFLMPSLEGFHNIIRRKQKTSMIKMLR